MQNVKTKKNKRAISDVVSVVLTITGVLIAVLILALSIQQLSDNILKSPEFDCIDLSIKPPVKIINTCYNFEDKDLNIELEKTMQNIEIKSLEFLISTSQTTETFFCSDSCSNCEIIKQGRKTYYLSSDDKPARVTIKINGCVLETREIINNC